MITVLKKELYRVFSDKKLFFTTFLLQPIITFVIYGLIIFVAMLSVNDVNAHQSVVTVYNQPSNLEFDDGFKINKLTGSYEDFLKEQDAVRDKEIDLAVYFPEEFVNKVHHFEVGNLPEVKYMYYSTEDYSSKAKNDYFAVLDEFKKEVQITRIGSEDYLDVYREIDISKDVQIIKDEQLFSKMISNLIPPFIIIFLAASVMGIIMESIPGEKEKGILATQLLTPVSRASIALGKIFALSIISIISVIFIVLSYVFLGISVLFFLPKDILANIDVSIIFTPMQFVQLFIILLAVDLLIVSIMLVFSVFGKNIKEANGFITPAYLFIMMCSFVPMYMKNLSGTWRYLIPVYGQVVALVDLLNYELTSMNLIIVLANAMICCGIAVFFIKNVFDNEKMIMNK